MLYGDYEKLIGPMTIFLILLSPAFTIIPGRPAIRGEDSIIIFFCLTLLGKYSSNKYSIKYHSVPKVISFLMAIVFISTVINGFNNDDLLLRDFFFIFLLLKYMILFKIAASTPLDENAVKRYIIAILSAGFLQSMIALCQYYNLLSINSWLTPYITGWESRIDSLLHHWNIRRVLGTVGNPNSLGNIFVTISAIAISITLNVKDKKYIIVSLLFIILMAFSITLTLSRASLISFVFVLVFASFIMIIKKNKLKNSFAFLLAVITILALSFKVGLGTLSDRFRQQDVMSYGSIVIRIIDLTEPFDMASDSIIKMTIGHGSVKALGNTYIHNDYGWYFHKYGFAGLAGYIVLLIVILHKAINGYNVHAPWWQNFIITSVFLVTINWVVFALSVVTISNMQLASINIFFSGLLYAKRRNA